MALQNSAEPALKLLIRQRALLPLQLHVVDDISQMGF